MLSINNNLMAVMAANNLSRSYNMLSKSINRLSSGLRINGAADDAAGLAVRELLRSDVTVLNQGIRNANDAVSMLQTMDGAAGVIDEKLIRMKELAEQASTGTYSSEQREIMNDEFSSMRDEIDRIAKATDFNGHKMLNVGSAGTAAASAVAQVLDFTETDAAMSAATGLVEDAFGTGASAGTIAFSFIDSNGSAGTASFSYVSGTTVDAMITSINAIAAFDGTAAWTSGTGLTITGSAAGVSQLDFTLSAAAVFEATVTTEGAAAQEAVDGSIKIHFGTGNDSAEDYYYVEKQNMTAEGLGIDELDISTQHSAQAALLTLDDAILDKDKGRAHFGAMINRLENTVTNLTIQSENIQAAESQISDVDVAFEMTVFMNTQIKAQAAIAMLSQANMLPQMALSLLGG